MTRIRLISTFIRGIERNSPREMDTIASPVCSLCQDNEQAGFVHGVQAGMLSAKELAYRIHRR